MRDAYQTWPDDDFARVPEPDGASLRAASVISAIHLGPAACSQDGAICHWTAIGLAAEAAPDSSEGPI